MLLLKDRYPQKPRPSRKTATGGNSIYQSIEKYLRRSFALGRDWEHPDSHIVYPNEAFKAALLRLKEENPNLYSKVYILLRAGNVQKQALAAQLYVSTSTLQRTWNEAYYLILLYLANPEIAPIISRNRRD